jgi:CRP-like cAMP-binding protein
MPFTPGLDVVVEKLARRTDLTQQDQAAILALPHAITRFAASGNLVREGVRPSHCSFILSGFAYRDKIVRSGARQITAVMMPGDFVDLPHLFLGIADQGVHALTPLIAASIEAESLRRLALDHPAVARAFWVEASIDAAIDREWIVNVGRREAIVRVAHLLCELSLRTTRAGLSDGDAFEVPMTQEQIGDAVGLTAVHVNRVLRALTDKGLVARDGRFYRSPDWERLEAFADFSPLYLHLDKADPAAVHQKSRWVA